MSASRSFALFLLAVFAALALAPASAQSVRQRWITANRHAIAITKDARKRAAMRATFALTLQAAHVAAVLPAPRNDPRRLATTILSNHRLYRFGAIPAAQPPSWLQRLWSWFAERWSRLLHLLFGRGYGGTVASAIGDLILLIAGMSFLYFVARVVYAYWRPQRAVTSGSVRLRGAPSGEELYARAQQAAKEGKFAHAIALIFRAALAALGHVDEHAVERETVGALRRNVRSKSAELGVCFDVIAKALTAAIYAERPIGDADFQTSSRAFEQLRSVAGELARG